MLFTLQFPFADLRPFLKDHPAMIPELPSNPDDQEAFKQRIEKSKAFVRSFGHITNLFNPPKFKKSTKKNKPKSPEACFWKDCDNLWSDEVFYTVNKKALMFPALEKQQIAGDRLNTPTALQRRFHFSPYTPGKSRWTPCMRIEIGINYETNGDGLSKKELFTAINGFLHLETKIPENDISRSENETDDKGKRSRKKYSDGMPLYEQSQNLAHLIVRTMSPHKEKRILPDMVKAGSLLLTIHLRPHEIQEFPDDIHWVSCRGISEAKIGYLPASKKITINTWIFVMPSERAKREKAGKLLDGIRNHTIAIMRYWSELRAMLLVKSYVEDNKDFGFDIRQGNSLETYLIQISDFLCQTKWHGTNLSIIADTIKTYENATNIDFSNTREHIRAFTESIITKGKIPKNLRPYLFICYSHADTEWKNKVERELKKHKYDLDYFVDTQIGAGDLWEKKIEKKIEAASYAILLVSDNFFNSEFITTDELNDILDSYNRHKINQIIPIWISGKLPEKHWLRRHQLLKAHDEPLEQAGEQEFNSLMATLIGTLTASPT
jgi:hypothetical protein